MPSDDVVLVKTETGSVYIIDRKNKRWVRTSTTPNSGTIRLDGLYSSYNQLSLELGHGMWLVCAPLPDSIPGTTARVVQTSAVVSIEPFSTDGEPLQN